MKLTAGLALVMMFSASAFAQDDSNNNDDGQYSKQGLQKSAAYYTERTNTYDKMLQSDPNNAGLKEARDDASRNAAGAQRLQGEMSQGGQSSNPSGN